jgi:hypothetical protein
LDEVVKMSAPAKKNKKEIRPPVKKSVATTSSSDVSPALMKAHVNAAAFDRLMALETEVATLKKTLAADTNALVSAQDEIKGLKAALKKLSTASGRLVYGSHGTTFLPGQMRDWKTAMLEALKYLKAGAR